MKTSDQLKKSLGSFTALSWGSTAALVLSMLGFAAWKVLPARTDAPQVPATSGREVNTSILPALDLSGFSLGIVRNVTLVTDRSQSSQYDIREYSVSRGDSIIGIADQYNLEPDTVLASNYDILEDDPYALQPGQVLKIPPVDGVYYQWDDDDTLQSVAEKFEVEPAVILDWVANGIDLTNPVIESGTWVMIPGGVKKFSFAPLVPAVVAGGSGPTRESAGTCGGGAVGSGNFVWPTANHYLSGKNFSTTEHKAIDLAAAEGALIFAADHGVIVLAAGGWNYGYGNVLMIDHNNGFLTLYAHLSGFNVQLCQSVYAGSVIGYSGNTGNSYGAHLHFEIRAAGGGFYNPWSLLPPP
ncbi:MAG: M23 family metallopeptidase [Chloroflexi bacterium]|nr:M23 family metallopeptidase [Chloroflexota bacterium]